ncbi:hypothetical protein [Polaromonas eurypsychrophila]|nr:hypothetical protein [Polaromonas eurypsychrophila]
MKETTTLTKPKLVSKTSEAELAFAEAGAVPVTTGAKAAAEK